MADRPWRVEAVPIDRAAWPDDRVDDPIHADPVAISRCRATDLVLVGLVVAGLVAALIKPWGANGFEDRAPPAPNVSDGRVPAAPVPAAPVSVDATPMVVALPPPLLPSDVFAPPARACIEDVGWRICVLGAAGDDGRAVRDYFAPDTAPLLDSPGSRSPADPLLVLSTTSGATIAFYPPEGLSIPDANSLPAPAAQPDGTPVIANGPVTVDAWWVDRAVSKKLAFLRAGAVVHAGRVAANVLVPASEDFSGLSEWRAGRYVVWVAGVGSRPWELSFDFEVIGS